VSAGDPVDPCTGHVFTEMYRDLELGGNLPLHLDRMYSSASRQRDLGFGFGWTHTFAHQVEVRRRSVILWKSDGTSMSFPKLEVEQSAVGPYGYKLSRTGWGYVLECGDYQKRYFAEATDDGRLWRLTAIEDWNGNRDTIRYANGTISEITDAVGRGIRMQHSSRGQIRGIDVYDPIKQQWVRFAELWYDDRGDLVEARDADGHTTRFTYDDDHRLTSHTSPAGLRFNFVYDRQGRCIETWGEYADGSPERALSQSLPEHLADGSTKAKGIYHCVLTYGEDGYSECIDSQEVRRYFANEFGSLDKAVGGGGVVTRTYDALGFETSKTDASGATWYTERDERGRPLRFIDSLGAAKTITRNEIGRPVEIVDEHGGVSRYEYDVRGNKIREIDPRGGCTTFEYDDRGLLTRRTSPNGATRDYIYDKYANLIEVRRINGGSWRFEYDGFGYLTARVAPDGGRQRFVRSPRGDIRAITDEQGHEWHIQTDARKNLRRVVEPSGAVFELDYGGVDWLCETRRPSGENTRITFDRNGMPVELFNAKGERHSFDYGSDGLIKKEVHFDGRTYRYTHDSRGLLTRMESDHGDAVDYEYDAAEQPVSATDQDDNEIRYEWDDAGNLRGASNGCSRIFLERNVVGDVVAEHQVLDGEEVVVESVYDESGNRTSVKSSLGYESRFELDAMGERQRILLDGRHPVDLTSDLTPQEISRRLPGGGIIRTERDLMGRQRSRFISGSESAPEIGEPQWVGGTRRGVRETGYRWSPAGELSEIDDSERGTTTLEYDLAGHLISCTPPDLPRERFGYDADGNAIADNQPTVFGAGDRLLERGAVKYVWDDGGRLVEKRVPGEAGASDVWRYQWLSSGLLGRVERPDGGVIEHEDDAFARRLEKRVRRPGDSAVERTRYVWDHDWLLQEITSRTDAGKTVRIRQRDYCFYANSMAPCAHADVVFDEHGEAVDRVWYHYANDPFGFPEHLVDAQGKVAATLLRRAFGGVSYAPGAKTTTPVRKLGQLYDDETGLCYNRWRYYDPETGRYISPDPRGVHGSTNAYTLGRNPYRWDDPFGLQTAESQRAAQLAEGTHGSDCYAVGRLDDGSTIITRNSDSPMPRPSIRDGTEWPGQRGAGANPPGAITQGEFRQTTGIDPATGTNPRCNDAEQRMIRHAEANNRRIESISATNYCCANCRAALRAHNPNIVITDRNGQAAPNP